MGGWLGWYKNTKNEREREKQSAIEEKEKDAAVLLVVGHETEFSAVNNSARRQASLYTEPQTEGSTFEKKR